MVLETIKSGNFIIKPHKLERVSEAIKKALK